MTLYYVYIHIALHIPRGNGHMPQTLIDDRPLILVTDAYLFCHWRSPRGFLLRRAGRVLHFLVSLSCAASALFLCFPAHPLPSTRPFYLVIPCYCLFFSLSYFLLLLLFKRYIYIHSSNRLFFSLCVFLAEWRQWHCVH